MATITRITANFAVASALSAADLAHIAALGFRTVINNRLDNEERSQPETALMRSATESHGLAYVHVPVSKLEIFTDPVVSAMADAIGSAPGPILAHCASGTRSAIVWAAARARSQSVDDILAVLSAAGLELGFLRDDLDSQADRARWAGAPAVAVDASDNQGRAA